MTLWRISRHDDLQGLGGERADGRWHTARRGKRIVYLSEHPALALIEVLVNIHYNTQIMPDRFRLMKVRVPDSVIVEAAPELSKEWRNDLVHSRFVGDSWLEAGTSALLAVPSAPSPDSTNYLLNASHASAREMVVESCRWLEYDRRLFQSAIKAPA